MQPKIIPELESLLPELTNQEYNGLLDSIRDEGLKHSIYLGRLKGEEDYFIIDGHNRYSICRKLGINPTYSYNVLDFDNLNQVKIWVILFQFAKGRELPPFVRAELAEKLESLIEGRQGERSDLATSVTQVTEVKHPTRQAAEIAKMSHNTYAKAKKLMKEAPEEIKKSLRKEKLSINKAYSDQIKLEKIEARKKEQMESHNAARTAKKYTVFKGDISLGLHEIEDNSIDCIITDPPYPKEFLDTFLHLSKVAKRVLKASAPCIVMSGQMHLPSVLEHLSTDLNYHWISSYRIPGSPTQVWGRKISNRWKPLLIMSKGKLDWHFTKDEFESDKSDKRFHEWGQSVSGMVDIVTSFTREGQLILDPFCGGGATGEAALTSARRFVGADIDENCVSITAGRLERAAGQ
jgi:16S rRNA G966 N2-methylase RsmD